LIWFRRLGIGTAGDCGSLSGGLIECRSLIGKPFCLSISGGLSGSLIECRSLAGGPFGISVRCRFLAVEKFAIAQVERS
jgi:hypothetical protein